MFLRDIRDELAKFSRCRLYKCNDFACRNLWALTVIAFEALTGVLPFATTPVDEWRRGILSGTFTPLNKHIHDAPERWQSFFAGWFAENRTTRPLTVTEFFKQLEQTFS
jgi:hypothetical protein